MDNEEENIDYHQQVLDSLEAHNKENEVLAAMDELLRTLQRNKPNDRSEKDRVYAVALTDVQRAYAWFAMFAYDGLPQYEEGSNDRR